MHMSMKKIVLAAMISAAFAGSATANTAITFSGAISAGSCNIEGLNASLSLGQLGSNLLVEPGASGPWQTEVPIRITECASGVSNAVVTASSLPDVDDTRYIANTGTAESVALYVVYKAPTLTGGSSTALSNGTSFTAPITDGQSEEIIIGSRLKSTLGNATPGTLDFVNIWNVTYN